MIRVYQAQDLPQAQLIIDLLEQHKICAELHNGNASSAMGDIPFTHAYPEIWIKHEKDKSIARQLIAEFEKPISDEQWLCKHCEEYSPVTFDYCWKCTQLREPNGQN